MLALGITMCHFNGSLQPLLSKKHKMKKTVVLLQFINPWTLLFRCPFSAYFLDGQRQCRNIPSKVYLASLSPPTPHLPKIRGKAFPRMVVLGQHLHNASQSIRRGNGRTRLWRDFRSRRRRVKGTPGNKWVYSRSSTFRPNRTPQRCC